MESIRSAFALIFSSDRTEVLMIERKDLPIWEFPGGGLDIGESPETAVIREVKEETGFDVEIVKILTTFDLTLISQKIAFFECKIISGDLTLGDETKNIKFFSIQKIPRAHAPLCPLILKSKNKKETIGSCRFIYILMRYLICDFKLTIKSCINFSHNLRKASVPKNIGAGNNRIK
jgi:8-oxo-dGTP pyrophosphatase MutT (NUDIX family)